MPVKRRSTASSSKAVVQEEEQQEEDVVENEDDDDSEDGSDSDESEEVEMLATSRERRGNAGAKMAQLLEKEDPDEFYQSTYGGFFDEGVDNDYQSPTQSDSDDADSDFDKPESDDEPISDTEDAAGSTMRRKTAHVGVYKEPKLRPSTTVVPKPQRTKREPRKEDQTPIIEKKFRWSTLQKSAMSGEARKKIKARFLVQGGPGSHQHKEYTQEELLAEAKVTEQMNTKSLEKYQQYELEQKRKRDRAMKRRVIDGPKIRTLSVSMPVPPADIRPGEPALCSGIFVEFPDEHSLRKHFAVVAVTRPAKVRRGDSRCCVTGQPAKYRDPVTGLPYATTDAFKQLRQRYEAWVLEKADVSDANVAAWVSWRQSATASS